MKSIKKAIIPVAGLGTRFLPATKTVPKELLPIVDKPTIMYIVEEAIEAGIEDIIFIAGRNKEAIEDFFDVSFELEKVLEKDNRTDLLQDLVAIRNKANFISIRQKEPLGLGHAVFCAKPVIGNDPFAVLLGDELSAGSIKTTQELVSLYEKELCSCVAIMEVEKESVSKYGIIDGVQVNKNTYEIKRLVEKPSQEDAPSRYAMPGRYVFTAGLLDELQDLPPGRNREIQLTDAMDMLAKKERMLGYISAATRYDAGDKLGYLVANIEMGLNHPQIGSALKQYIKQLKGNL
ncbi:MAG: UTP--glucose-1-phosphate uridylyltransferase GalU [Bdellovibrionales bacterium]|nr:UTP--glucose-1-phosphate uridylyltransferase GalU [Bdellovibrionales bacterium]